MFGRVGQPLIAVFPLYMERHRPPVYLRQDGKPFFPNRASPALNFLPEVFRKRILPRFEPRGRVLGRFVIALPPRLRIPRRSALLFFTFGASFSNKATMRAH